MQKKIKTLWLTVGFLDRDMELNARIQIMNALIKQNVEVRASFNIIQKSYPLKGFSKIKMLHIRNQGIVGKFILLVKQQIVLVNNLDVDVVVVWPFNLHQILPLWFFWRKILCKKRPKFILDVRSLPADFPGKFMRKQRQKRFDTSIRIAFRFFDGITMITDKMKKELQKKANNLKKEICVWSSGVDPNLFDPNKSGDHRSELGLNGRFVIMYHGILSPARGLQQTIESIDIVRKSHPEVMLILLGKGPAKKELEEMVRKQRLEEHVLIHPAVNYEKIPKYINSAQVGILPFPKLDVWNTSSPIKLNEYLAMGKPIIVTDIEAHRSALGESKCCFYIPNNLPESIAITIKSILEKPSILSSMGEIARKTAIDRFTWEIQAQKIRVYFQNLLK